MSAPSELATIVAVARSAAGSDADECAAMAIALEHLAKGIRKLGEHVTVRMGRPDLFGQGQPPVSVVMAGLATALASADPAAAIDAVVSGLPDDARLTIDLPEVKRRNLPRWFVQQTQAMVVPMRDKTIMVQVGQMEPGGVFQIVAIETLGADALRAAGSENQAAAAIFDHHAHEVLGDKPTLDEAIAVAEDYVRAWLKGLAPAAEPCPCGPIGEHPNAEGPG